MTASAAISSQPTAAPAKPGLFIDGDSAVITILIKPDKAADFEGVVLQKLREALQKSNKPARKSQAAGWRVFKAVEAVQGNAVYVMRIDPVVREQDYDIIRIISEEFASEARAVSQTYRDAFADRSIMVTNRMAIEGLGSPTAPSDRGAAPVRDRAGQAQLALSLNADAAMITLIVKPDKAADFESTVGFLGRALQKSDKPGRREQAAGWRVLKSNAPVDGNAVYVMSIDPVVRDQEYDLIRLIGEVYPDEIQEIFRKYREAYVAQAIVRLAPLMALAP